MVAAAFEQVDGAFQEFHAYFDLLFGRKEARHHSRHYVPALAGPGPRSAATPRIRPRRFPAWARARPRRLTEAGRDDDAVIVILHEYPAPRLAPPLAVGVFCGSDFAKPGARSVGVALGGSVGRWGR